MSYAASAYGPWVGNQQWRAWVGVNKSTETATYCEYTVYSWLCAGNGSSSYASNIQGWAGIWDAVTNDYRWSSAVDVGSFSAGDEWQFKSQTWRVTKTKQSQTVYFYTDIIASSGIYSGNESKASCTLTLGAKSSYAVKYNANAPSGTATNMPSNQTKWHGETLTLSSKVPKLTGYTFKGWATSSSGSVTYAAGAKYTTDAAVTLYAKWQADTYTISYDGNGATGGSTSSQTRTYGGSAITVRANGFTRTNYAFLHWDTKADDSGTDYTAGSSTYQGNANLKLYAIWHAPYTVTYNANGGSGAPASQTKVYNSALTLSSTKPTRTGYSFSGWNTQANGSGTPYASGGTVSAGTNSNLTLYAQWTAQAPTLTIQKVYRCDQNDAADDEGTYVRVEAKWTQAASYSVVVTASVKVGGTTYQSDPTTASTSSTGSPKMTIDTSGTLLQDTSYTVTVSAVANNQAALTTTKTYTLGSAKWPIDVKAGGDGIAFGGAANDTGFHVHMPATFHDTLTAPNIGVYLSNNDTKSVASGTGTAICSVTLDAGVWSISGHVQFAANGTGLRNINLSTSSGSNTDAVNAQTGARSPNCGSGNKVFLSTTWNTQRSATTTVYLNAYQDSGSSLSCTGYIRAVRIR